jgi:kumamolisin
MAVKARLRKIAALAAPLPILALAAAPASAHPSASERVALTSEVVAAATPATRIGTLAADTRLSLEISLAPRNQTGLDAFIASVSDPSSKAYKHYATVAQFAADYGATPGTIASVTSYLKGEGLSVAAVTANHLTLAADGTAAQVDAAFGVTLGSYRSAAGPDFYASTSAPSLPTAIAAEVDGIAGLTDEQQLSHSPLPTQASKTALVSSGLSPIMARDGYNLATDIKDGYSGTGETVGLAEFSAYTASDIATYNTTYSLGAPSPTVVKVDGGTTDTSGRTEDEVDIEIVNALAPGAKVHVYEAPNTDAGEVALYAALVSNDVPIVSTSWSEPETDDAELASDDADFKEAAAQGQSVYAASGDSGPGSGGVQYPASDPYVTGVGCTDLTLTAAYAWSSETADSACSGGTSVEWHTPSYQVPVNSGSYREVPDVAANAGASWRIYTEGSWEEIGGGSLTPNQWAAFTADYDTAATELGKAQFGYADPFIYTVAQSSKYHTAFHDITSGAGAGPGYDLATGWGSFNGGGFITDEL